MRSWLPSANAVGSDFPVQNLPYGVFSHGKDAPRCGVAIGDRVLDLAALEADGLLPSGDAPVFSAPELNPFMERGPKIWAAVRARLTDLLRESGDGAVRQKEGRYLHPLAAVTLYLPFRVSEYTDFYAGKQHAFNVGTMFRGPENALPPNWLHIPIGYNGRASSVVVSGTDFHRPKGQLKAPDAEMPEFGPSKRLDIELEIGAVVGTGSGFGKPVSVAEADEMIFGYVLLNDWSARDIQAWEYQPLGPFQGKAFCTTISPWVVTRAALEPFRTSTPEREKTLLPYLEEPGPMLYDIDLEVALTPAGSDSETVVSRTNYGTMYYSAAQQLAHHSSSGCPMRTGDLLGSGTISGATPDSYGSLLEMSWGGKTPIELPGGVTRSFLEDGDRVTLRGHAQGKGYRIGFGDCTGRVLPARD
ncbi:fumarylacetoacetase [Nisaea acidiphila]|uniref:fumarylacetoacetase n=1 Tax=Nisaea acidiphila TaxID=1862145 RepID=A0A9J7AV18_9PROT|nr:fumarylacetoacetase [Nisaea acidiphila]UUX51175.1 fumarylacetoacetase [Nisaea acidiphila]